jgi:FkbM family methyltransferase
VSAVVPGSIAVYVGAGEDISFDVELSRIGMSVFTLDPTPREKKHVKEVLDGAAEAKTVPIANSPADYYDLRGFDTARFSFLDSGLSHEDKTMRFWEPKNPAHVSHSIVNLQHTDRYFDAKCIRLQTLCDEREIDHIQILKLDIEGAEYAVLGDLLAGHIRPSVICVEFDEGSFPQDRKCLRRISDAVKKLKKFGYLLPAVEGWNFLFVLNVQPHPVN